MILSNFVELDLGPDRTTKSHHQEGNAPSLPQHPNHHRPSAQSVGKKNTLRAASALLPLALATSLSADISCPPIFDDHMVLQQEEPIRLWGDADPGEEITATFAGRQAKTTTADAQGHWSLTLPAQPASFELRTLTLSGNNTLTFQDVLVGEVWLLSGQSNMDKPLGEKRGQKPSLGYPDVLQEADLPHLRLFRVPNNVKIKDKSLELHWIPCSSESIDPMQFSAAGFHFGKKLLEELDVPIGLIHSAFGGTMIEAWMPEAAFQSDPQLAPLRHKEYFSWVKGVQATELYESMIQPLVPYTIRGFLWYQGESNLMHGDGTIYQNKMQALVSSWRELWQDKDLPFYFAQIAPFTYSEYIGEKSLTPHALPLFWKTQLDLVDPDTHMEMIPTLDLVENVRDIHPTNKRDIGLRFAKLALTRTYGFDNYEITIPKITHATESKDGFLKLELSQAIGVSSNWLSTPQHEGKQGIHPFQIAGEDLRYFPATITQMDGALQLSNPSVENPIFVRYGWDEKFAPSKAPDNTLPLYPFRNDPAPLETLEPPFHEAFSLSLSQNVPITHYDKSRELTIVVTQPTADQLTVSIDGLKPGPHSLLLQLENDPARYALFTAQEDVLHVSTFSNISSIPGKISIDAPNPKKQANLISPKQEDLQSLISGQEMPLLRWTPAPGATSYRVYLYGDDDSEKAFKKVNHAGRSSSTLLLSTSSTRAQVSLPDTSSIACRIDAIDPSGSDTRGNVQLFTKPNPIDTLK